MIKVSSDYKGIYADMVDILGEDIVMKLHKYYKGQQVTFPIKLYSDKYVQNYIIKNYKYKNLKDICRELGYTEGWVKQLLNKIKKNT